MNHEQPAVGMKRSAGRGTRFLRRLTRRDVAQLRHQPGFIQAAAHELALIIDVWIDLMCYPVVAIVAVKSDVMSRGPDPEFLSLHLKRRFPQPPVVALRDDVDRHGVRPTIIL